MAKQKPPFGVRMPDDLKAYLAIQAKKNGRSINMEIVVRLQQTRNQEQKNV